MAGIFMSIAHAMAIFGARKTPKEEWGKEGRLRLPSTEENAVVVAVSDNDIDTEENEDIGIEASKEGARASNTEGGIEMEEISLSS